MHIYHPAPSKNDAWIKQLNENRYASISSQQNISSLTLDFKDFGFVRPVDIVTLACLIEEYAQNNIPIEFKNEGQYIRDIRLTDYWHENFDRDKFTSTKIDTALCLWHISREMMHNYTSAAKNYFETHYFDDKNLDPLTIVLGEIFNNIFDHSKSQCQGYVFTQYYPKEGKIRTAVCDFGIGIPSAVNNKQSELGEELLSQTSALEESLKKGFTTQSTPNNKGFGLDTLTSIIKALKSKVGILSNTAGYFQTSDGIKFKGYNNSFPGTLISLELDCKFLDEKEEMEDMEFHF